MTSPPSETNDDIRTIGPYRLVLKVGEGGMGEVWLAEQTQPLRRQVALKLIKPGMDTVQVIARFEAERQALAMMDHPNIAKVFDGGATADGHPYFVMEYVRGEPITDYCDHRRMSLRSRLELFASLCDGVQHAHQKGVIHRDLKPSNVLVSESGDQAIPRIIDFGIAKAVAQRLTDVVMRTEVGSLVGTPEYMSPEQADGASPEVDTRSDVYSLGMILYELIVGALPFDATTLRSGTPEEMRRTIREREPARPSARAAELGDQARSVSALRRMRPSELASTLRGDLDWIVLKAIEKFPVRRYETANALAQDVRRYLRHEPVQAGPPSALYRGRKFVRRHRMGVTTLALLGLVAVSFGVAMGIQARHLALERDRATAAQVKAEEVIAFLVRMFQASDPSETRGENLTARELLESGVERVDTLSREPEVQAQLLDVMGRVYQSLGNFEKARVLLERGLSGHRQTAGATAVEVGTSLAHLSDLLYLQGRYAEAEAAAREALAIHDASLGRKSAASATDLTLLAAAVTERGDLVEAQRLFEEALAIRRVVLDRADPEIAENLSGLGYVASRRGDYAEMERDDREALAIVRAAFGEHHPRVALAMSNLGAAYERLGRYDEAVRVHSEALSLRRALFGNEHPTVANSLNNLANSLGAMKKFAEAEPLAREVLALRRKLLGPDHPSTMTALNNLAVYLIQTNRAAEGETLIREARANIEKRLPPSHPVALVVDTTLAAALAAQHQDAEAETLFKLTHMRRVAALGADHPDVADGLVSYARFLGARKRYAEAEAMFSQILDIRTKRLGPQHPLTVRAETELADLRRSHAASASGDRRHPSR
jgi:serine/threonine protein kinase/tetratricopeptide (TPR) repeat protein